MESGSGNGKKGDTIKQIFSKLWVEEQNNMSLLYVIIKTQCKIADLVDSEVCKE